MTALIGETELLCYYLLAIVSSDAFVAVLCAHLLVLCICLWVCALPCDFVITFKLQSTRKVIINRILFAYVQYIVNVYFLILYVFYICCKSERLTWFNKELTYLLICDRKKGELQNLVQNSFCTISTELNGVISWCSTLYVCMSITKWTTNKRIDLEVSFWHI